MGQFLGYVNRDWAKRANGRNTVIVSAANEDDARERAEQVLGANDGELGSAEHPNGWVFVVLSSQEGFMEGHFVSADKTLNTVAQRGA